MEDLVIRSVIKAAYEKQAKDLSVFSFDDPQAMTSYQILCSSENERQSWAIADHIQRECRTSHKVRPFQREGEKHGRWISLDYGFMIVHIMLSALRQDYQLEGFFDDVGGTFQARLGDPLAV
jgi:ribosome-associated protein